MVRCCKRCGIKGHFFRECKATDILNTWDEPDIPLDLIPLRENNKIEDKKHILQTLLLSEKGDRHEVFANWVHTNLVTEYTRSILDVGMLLKRSYISISSFHHYIYVYYI